MRIYHELDSIKRIAICIFGPDTSIKTSEFKKKADELYPGYATVMFRDASADKFKSLYKVAFKKRKHEVLLSLDFSFCVGISADSLYNLEICKMPENIKDDTVYYSKGCFSNEGRTGAYPDSFLCKTLEFDRCAEIYHNIKNIDKTYSIEPEIFYYHLKSLKLKTECINFENSNLFVWTAPIN